MRPNLALPSRTMPLRPGDLPTKAPTNGNGHTDPEGPQGPPDAELPQPVVDFTDIQMLQALQAFIKQVSPPAATATIEQLKDKLLPLLVTELSDQASQAVSETVNRQLQLSQENLTRRLAENKAAIEEMITKATKALDDRTARLEQRTNQAAADFNTAVAEWSEKADNFPSQDLKSELVKQLGEMARQTAKLVMTNQRESMLNEIILSANKEAAKTLVDLFGKATKDFRQEIVAHVNQVAQGVNTKVVQLMEEHAAKQRAELESVLAMLEKVDAQPGATVETDATETEPEPESGTPKFRVIICSMRLHKHAAELERLCPKNIRLVVESMDRTRPNGKLKRAHMILMASTVPGAWIKAFRQSVDADRIQYLSQDSMEAIKEKLEELSTRDYFPL